MQEDMLYRSIQYVLSIMNDKHRQIGILGKKRRKAMGLKRLELRLDIVG